MNPTPQNAPPPPASPCPTQPELSAFADGDTLPQVEAHVKVCVSCATVISFYRQINDIVARRATPPPGLANRIQAGCRRDAAQQRQQNFQLLFWRVAAVAAIVLTVSVVLWPDSAPLAPAAVATTAPTAAKVPVLAPPAGSANSATVMEDLATAPGKTITQNQVADVGLAKDNQQPRGSLHIAANRVRHVWVAKNVTESLQQLGGILPPDAVKLDLPATAVANNSDQRVMYRLTISDQQLQGLVDRLAESGLSLVSPGYPQPGGRKNLLTNGRQITYDMEIVPSTTP